MDLIRQNKLVGWSIAILVALNIVTLSIIWVQSKGTGHSNRKSDDNPPAEAVRLLQTELGFSDTQIQRYTEMREDFQQQTKPLNEELTALKLRLADQVVASEPDKKTTDSIAGRIGMLQSRIELLRFEHFRSLVRICSEEQLKKLQPVLREVFGRKPPLERTIDEARKERKEESGKPSQHEARPAPPSVEEKIERYSERLSLTPEQVNALRNILSTARTRKPQSHPGDAGFEQEKERVLKDEDESVLRILNPDQKAEFEKMVRNRGMHKPPR